MTAVVQTDKAKQREEFKLYSDIQKRVDKAMTDRKIKTENLRSRLWFNNPDDAEMTALYTERYLNYGLTRDELRAGKPIIGIAQTGSDLSPCNRHHLELAKRVRDGIISAGGVPMEIPVHPIQETGKRPTASSTEIWPISAWLRAFMAIRLMVSC